MVPKRQRAGPNRAVVHCKSRFGNGASTSERGVLERELGTGIPPDKEPSDSNDRQSGPQKVGRMPEGRDLGIYPKQKPSSQTRKRLGRLLGKLPSGHFAN